jgi:hypothetical protein
VLTGEVARFHDAFDTAASRRGVEEHTLGVAGATVTLRFASRALAAAILPALRHLGRAAATPDLTVSLWDTESSGVPLPTSALLPRPGGMLRPMQEHRSVSFHLQVAESILTLFDREQRRAVVAARRASLPLWERAAPLRVLWQRWLADRGVALVHAAAIGLADGPGVLLTGPGGSGKSTTTVLCNRAGMACAGDDYVVFDPATSTAWSMYRSVKLDWNHRRLLTTVANNETEEKAFGFLDEPASNVSVVAILLPRVTDAPATTLADAPPAEALRDLAPRAVLPVPDGAPLYSRLGEAVRRLPVHRLLLGSDTETVAPAVAGFLTNAGAMSWT